MFTTRIENLVKLSEQEEKIVKASSMIKIALFGGNKVLLCGNGGSASQCNHLAAELVGRFQKERVPAPAISLVSDNAVITAIANDYSFDDIFKRQIEALGKKGDILIAISTSGHSENVINAIMAARNKGMKTILLTGGRTAKFETELQINAPSMVTAEIQEMHLAIAHLLCEMLEN